jgi:predicted CoA-binding protein
LLIIIPKTETLGVVEEAVKKGIPNLWIEQMSEAPESIEYDISNKVNLVTGQCILMFA